MSFVSVVTFKGVIRSRPSVWRKLITPPPPPLTHPLDESTPWLPKHVRSQRFQGATWELLVGIPGIVPLQTPTTFVVLQCILRWLTTELIITKRVVVTQVLLYWNLYLYSIGNLKKLKFHRTPPGYSQNCRFLSLLIKSLLLKFRINYATQTYAQSTAHLGLFP